MTGAVSAATVMIERINDFMAAPARIVGFLERHSPRL